MDIMFGDIHAFFFISNAFFWLRLKCCLTKSQIFRNLALPYLTKKGFKMLFGMSSIILHRSRPLSCNIFQDLSFTQGKFQPSVAYKSVAYKRKSV